MTTTPREIVEFWTDAGSAAWYRKDASFDRLLNERFGRVHGDAGAGMLRSWSETAQGALAMVLLYDQFSRNMFRGSPRMFAQDDQARRVAREAMARGFDRDVDPQLRQFFCTPFMHSESLPDQDLSVRIAHALTGSGTLSYAREHREIIRRFGRFPHRNAILGRYTTPAEQRFLESGGFAG